MQNKITACLALSLLAASNASAQRTVPFAGDIPVAPELAVPPVPLEPVTYDTAEGMDMLVTEKRGTLRVIRNGVLEPEPAAGIPEVLENRRSGLNDLALHPDFESNRYVYFSYQKPMPNAEPVMALARGRWNGSALEGTEDLFLTDPGSGDRSRIAFGPDGTIYMSTAGGPPQDLGAHGGKILRLTDEGKVPDDNPFVDVTGAKPEVFTYGTRAHGIRIGSRAKA
jgi:glucose/arabinose dehydrogenase